MNNAAIFAGRRERLLSLLPGKILLLFSGPYYHRNIPGVIHPYRANSHFLYLFGWFPPNSVGVISAGESRVFVRHPSREDRFWNGDDDLASLAAESGVDALISLESFPPELAKLDIQAVRTVPPHRVDQRAEISRLLGREVSLEGIDRELVDALVSMRLVQDEAAISELRLAGRAARDSFAAAVKGVTAGKFEWEIRADLEHQIRSRNFDLSFPPIVTRRGDVLHNRSYDNKLENGDLLLMDFGTESSAGFASDITRVLPVSGSFTGEQQAIYDLVQSAQDLAIQSVGPGVRFRDLHLDVCRHLAAGLVELGIMRGSPAEIVTHGAHAVFFPHGLGHLLGLDVHDMEDLGDIAGYAAGRKRDSQFGLSFLRLDRDLKSGMAVTIEPGLYFIDPILNDAEFLEPFKAYLLPEGIERFRRHVRGIRIEDDIIVTDGGSEVLTR